MDKKGLHKLLVTSVFITNTDVVVIVCIGLSRLRSVSAGVLEACCLASRVCARDYSARNGWFRVLLEVFSRARMLAWWGASARV